MSADRYEYTRPQMDKLCDRALTLGIVYGAGVALALVLPARFLFGVH